MTTRRRRKERSTASRRNCCRGSARAKTQRRRRQDCKHSSRRSLICQSRQRSRLESQRFTAANQASASTATHDDFSIVLSEANLTSPVILGEYGDSPISPPLPPSAT